MITGIHLNSESAFRAASACKPFTRGMFRSIRIRCGKDAFASHLRLDRNSRAAEPSFTESTWHGRGKVLSTCWSKCKLIGLSSTSKIRNIFSLLGKHADRRNSRSPTSFAPFAGMEYHTPLDPAWRQTFLVE